MQFYCVNPAKTVCGICPIHRHDAAKMDTTAPAFKKLLMSFTVGRRRARQAVEHTQEDRKDERDGLLLYFVDLRPRMPRFVVSQGIPSICGDNGVCQYLHGQSAPFYAGSG